MHLLATEAVEALCSRAERESWTSEFVHRGVEFDLMKPKVGGLQRSSRAAEGKVVGAATRRVYGLPRRGQPRKTVSRFLLQAIKPLSMSRTGRDGAWRLSLCPRTTGQFRANEADHVRPQPDLPHSIGVSERDIERTACKNKFAISRNQSQFCDGLLDGHEIDDWRLE